MKIRNGNDFWAGMMFASVGLAFAVGAQNYPMGSAVRMGPAYFPTILGGLLFVLGAAIVVRAFLSKLNRPLKVFVFRLPMFIVSVVLGVIAFYSESLLKDMPMVRFALSGVALCLFLGSFGGKAMFMILLACLFYGYTIKPLGLVIGTVILIVISAAGGHDFRPKEVTILSIVLVLFSVYGFVKGLGLPFNLWPGE